MNKASIGLAVLIAAATMGISASAQERAEPSAARATQIVRLSGSMTGLLVASEGGCTKGFSDQCPSGHICSCFTGTGLKVSSHALGKGTANIFATLDNTASFALGQCGPIYAEIEITAKNDSPTFDASGGLCFEPDGEAVFCGVMGLESPSERFTTGSAGYTATLNCTSGLCGGSLSMALNFKGTAK